MNRVINKKLVGYFKEGLNNGNSVESLKAALLKAGHDSLDINDSADVVFPVKAKSVLVSQSNSSFETLEGKEDRPVLISILSILIWIQAGLTILGSLAVLFLIDELSSFFGDYLTSFMDLSTFSMIGFVSFALVALFSFFFGRGLWFGRNGWRIFYIILLVVLVIGEIISLFILPGYYGFYSVVPLLLIGYLGFNKKVKAFFRKN